MMNTVFLKLLQAMPLLLFHLLLQLLASHSLSALGTEVRCIENERQALLQLKAGFVNDYGFLSSWGNEEEKRDGCQWERVRCSNRTGHVQMLQLQGNGFYRQLIFRGNITTSLIELQHLRYLNLNSNDFEYSDIPEFIVSLSNLRYLDVSNSYLAGKIPYQLGSFSHLQYLDLSQNHLQGAIPSQLGNLSQLQFLNIRKNSLEAAIPYQLGNLSSLQMLYLGENYALKIHKEKSVEAQWLSKLTSLTVLDLSSVLNLNDSHNLLSNLQNLSELFLDGCSLSDDDLLFLESSKFNFSSLSILDLSYNNLSAKVLKSLGNICTLSILYLSNVNLNDDFSTILHNLSGCASSTLQALYLQFNQITGTLFGVSKFPSLKSLYLMGNQLMNGIPEDGNLDKCGLYLLDLTYNRLSVELPLVTRYLFGCRSTLQELYLGRNQITGRVPDISMFTSLKVLSLFYNQLNGIFENIKLPPQLAILQVSSNSIQDGILESFGKTCSLSHLGLSNNNISKELPVIIHSLFGCARSLKYLDLSFNQINGTMPDLSNFSSLQFLDLSFNELNVEIPMDIRFPSQLEALKIASNSKFKGVLTDSHFANMSMLQVLDLSLSSLTFTFSPSWVPPFQLSELNLMSCSNLGPDFPMWLQTQKSLISLDISDSRISDMVPEWFWSLFPVLESLNISYNNLTGTIPNSSIRFNRYPNIILASNQFEGSVPSFLQRATYVDLSRNKFSSFGMFACANSSSRRLGMVLDLSNNHLSGQLPDCWDNFKSLAYLDLSNNNLSGKIPTSIGSLVELLVLVLRNNTLSGDLPLSLKTCTNLKMLDVGENKFSGKIPYGIGNALKQLRMLSLRINHFTGSMPLDLCHLRSLEFLDLSSNNLTGEILKCLKDITAMSQKKSYANKAYIFNERYGLRMPYNAFLIWKGVDQSFDNTAFRLKSIDLSSNQLIGGIPMDIINLTELVSLNLSRNNLAGEIPSKIGKLKSLEFLDLSRNHFYGEIPSSLAQIDRLTMLDLSHNQLFGKIPTSTQLQSFDASSYEDNLALCGKPLEKDCPKEATQKPPKVEENDHSIFSQPFFISMALGFITGFWGIFGSILVNRCWRHAYFRFLNNLTDASYMIVAINIAKCRAWFNG